MKKIVKVLGIISVGILFAVTASAFMVEPSTETPLITVNGDKPSPEPAAMLLLGSGLVGLSVVGRKKRLSQDA